MKFKGAGAVLALALMSCGQASAALSPTEIDALRVRGEREGWTFTVGENEATRYAPDELNGLIVPKDWRADARFVSFKAQPDAPAAFDWRPYLPSVKNQGGCGSCWAFSTVGALECAISIRDGVTEDLSEQWLVSCNSETEPPHLLGGEWGCVGGWFAHHYHMSEPDPCGGFGAVLETDFPYQASDVACNCPYDHYYWIDSWAYVGGEEEIPDTDSIKQAIMTYGPVSAACYADGPFSGYDGGVFNASTLAEVNHGIVLVGWDDNLGVEGVWILRNSWGSNWGIDGYMYIEYGCSNVGFAACYIDYPGAGLGQRPTITKQPEDKSVKEDRPCTFRVEAIGVTELHYQWTKGGDPVGTDADTYTIPAMAGEHTGVYRCSVTDVRGTTVSDSATLQLFITEGTPTASTTSLIVLAAACAFMGVWMGTRLKPG